GVEGEALVLISDQAARLSGRVHPRDAACVMGADHELSLRVDGDAVAADLGDEGCWVDRARIQAENNRRRHTVAPGGAEVDVTEEQRALFGRPNGALQEVIAAADQLRAER